jgi:hypothetical protein
VAKLSEKHQFILYALLKYLQEVNKRFQNEPLEASISKIDFIKLLQSLKIVEKTERGLYKNLEALESGKYVEYDHRFLKLTSKGLNAVKHKDTEIEPYMRLSAQLGDHVGARGLQSYFK